MSIPISLFLVGVTIILISLFLSWTSGAAIIEHLHRQYTVEHSMRKQNRLLAVSYDFFFSLKPISSLYFSEL